MATIKLISEMEATPEVNEVFEDVKQHFNLDFVPNVFKAMANNPDALMQGWNQLKAIEESWGKEMTYLLSLAVDITNGCDYCINFDTAVLKQLGWDDRKIEMLVSFISMNDSYNKYVQGLSLEPDVTPEVMERRMAA